jgi:hypothetical protein
VVPYGYGQASYRQVPWPKAFLTIIGGDHGGYLAATDLVAAAVAATVLDFLRATLYGDPDALARIPADATVEDLTRFESTLAPPLLPAPSVQPSPTPEPSPTLDPSASPHPSPSG